MKFIKSGLVATAFAAMLVASSNAAIECALNGTSDDAAYRRYHKDDGEVAYVKNAIKDMTVESWNRNETKPLTEARAFAANCGSSTTAIELFAAVTDRIGYFKEECDESFSMHWSDGDADNAKSILRSWDSLPYPGLMVKTAAYIADKKMRGGDILLSAVDLAQRAAMSAAVDSVKVAAMQKKAHPYAVMEVEQLTDATELKKLVAFHPCALVRAAAAHKLGTSAFNDFAAGHKITAPGSNANVGGLFLGMDVGDAYVILAKKCPDLDYSFEIPESDDSVSSTEDCNVVATVKGSSRRIVYANKTTGKVRKIMLPPELVVKFFPDIDTVEEIGEAVAQALGLKMKEDYEKVKIKGVTVAEQNVLKYTSISGAFASLAIGNKEIDQSAIDMAAPYGEMAAYGFKAGVNYVIANQMGEPGTLILCGDKLKRRNATSKASAGDEIEARHQELLKKWGPKAQ